jgi:hypothetical protein
MVSLDARSACAAGPGRYVIVAGLLAVTACQGTEHVVFLPIPTIVSPPPQGMDAGGEPADAELPEDAPADAEPQGDAEQPDAAGDGDDDTLGISSEQQVLSIIDGDVKNVWGFEAARLAGSLRCVDKVFEAQTGPGMLWYPWTDYRATLGGQFDDQALVIEGNFLMTNAAGARCPGSFHVSAVP